MQEAAQRAAARHLHGGQGDDDGRPATHHHQAVRRPTPDQVAAQRAQREADRAQLLDSWTAEMRAIRAAADRAEATKKVVVSSTQQVGMHTVDEWTGAVCLVPVPVQWNSGHAAVPTHALMHRHAASSSACLCVAP